MCLIGKHIFKQHKPYGAKRMHIIIQIWYKSWIISPAQITTYSLLSHMHGWERERNGNSYHDLILFPFRKHIFPLEYTHACHKTWYWQDLEGIQFPTGCMCPAHPITAFPTPERMCIGICTFHILIGSLPMTLGPQISICVVLPCLISLPLSC